MPEKKNFCLARDNLIKFKPKLDLNINRSENTIYLIGLEFFFRKNSYMFCIKYISQS